MKFRLDYSIVTAKTNISGAQAFKFPLSDPLSSQKIRIEKRSLEDVIALCEEFDTTDISSADPYAILTNKEVSLGSRAFIQEEFSRVATHSMNLNGFLLGFPFKCPVPIKTNYHKVPDLGEIMFLYRMAKIAKTINEHTPYTLKLHLFEETAALVPVFSVTQKEAALFSHSLQNLLSLMNCKEVLSFVSLADALFGTQEEYAKRFTRELKKVKAAIDSYEELLQQILPTIALSVNTNKLSFEDSKLYIEKLFSREVSPSTDPELFETACRYITFINVQKQSNFRKEHYKDFLQFSLCPKKGRISIRPLPKSVKIWPHHGVPVVTIEGKKKTFTIMYFIDLIQDSRGETLVEIHDENDNFLYYERR